MVNKRENVYQILERELDAGHQAYVIYPRIGDEETENSAVQGFGLIKKRFSNYSAALLTSKSKDKERIIQEFRKGSIKILVGTTITEVGIDCPNANVCIIENADRFGLSTLHQIRGRVCRSQDTSFCFLMARTANQQSIDRLGVIEKCNDGFEIAEQDLRLRGPGEMFSTKQHGLPDLKFASLLDDYGLMLEAKDKAVDIIDKLDEPENAGIKQMLKIKYSDIIKLGNIV